MAKNFYRALVCIFSIVGYVRSQGSFEFCIDTEDDSKVWEAAVDDAGNVILVGNIGDFIELDYDGLVVRVHPDGTYITKRFDMQDTVSLFTTIKYLNNGHYFITGCFSPDGDYYSRNYFWIVILDQNLNIITEKSYKGRDPYISISTNAQSLVDNEGNIVLATGALHDSKREKTTFSDFAFYKFNPQGDTLVSKYYSYMWDELVYELRQMPGSDNMMLVEKSTHWTNRNELLFLDPDLNIITANVFPSQTIVSVLSGNLSTDCWVTDTSFILSGSNNYDMGTYTDRYIGVYLMDTSCNVYNELVLNKPDTTDLPAWKNSMAYANDSTIYIAGFQQIMGFWITDPVVVQLYMIDINMNLLGYKELGGDANYEVWGVIATPDDGCMMYGIRYDNPGVPERDVYIWKVLRDEINLITEVYETVAETETVSVYPNPSNDYVFVHLPNNLDWYDRSISLYTLDGKKVFEKKINESGNLININLRNLKSRLYILNIYEEGKVNYSGKLIKN
jgi:hypothetical protein